MCQTRKYTSKTHLLYRNTLGNQIYLYLQVCFVDIPTEIWSRYLEPLPHSVENSDILSIIEDPLDTREDIGLPTHIETLCHWDISSLPLHDWCESWSDIILHSPRSEIFIFQISFPSISIHIWPVSRIWEDSHGHISRKECHRIILPECWRRSEGQTIFCSYISSMFKWSMFDDQ